MNGGSLGYCFEIFFFSFTMAIYNCESLLSTVLAKSHKFLYGVFSFSLISLCLLISIVIYSLTHWLFIECVV